MKIRMKHYVICLITILFGVHAYGQQWRTGNVVVYEGADIEDVIPHSISFFFPEYIRGSIYFTDRKTIEDVLLNICLVDNTVRYVDKSGMLRKLFDVSNITKIIAGDDTIMNSSKGFARLLESYRDIYLVKKKILNCTGADESDNIRQRSSFDVQRFPPGEYTYEYREKLFIIEEGAGVYQVSQHTFRKVFPKIKKNISEFCNIRDMDFSNDEEVVDLFLRCGYVMEHSGTELFDVIRY